MPATCSVASMRRVFALIAAIGAAGCASARPKTIGPPAEEKIAWILRLEDRRILRDASTAVPPPGLPSRRAAAPAAPDLVRLLSDTEPRVRRRAALAVGRVGLAEGVPPLIGLLADPDPEMRQIAAFGLGLIGHASARDPLLAALADQSPLVQGSAAEALGLIGDAGAAPAIGALVARIVESGVLTTPPGDDEDAKRDTPAAAFRLGVYALVRLKAYDQLAAAVLDQSRQPRVRWWPVAYALQRLADARALNALMTLAKDPNPYTRAFAVKGLGAIKAAVVPVLLPMLGESDRSVLVETIRALGRIGDRLAAPSLIKLAQPATIDPHVRVEAVAALGAVRAPGVTEALLDAMLDSSPVIRAAALRAAAVHDADGFLTVLSGLDADPQWSVRAAIAEILGTLAPTAGVPRLLLLARDADQRVVPRALEALGKLKAPDAEALLLERLNAEDAIVRAAAATALGELKPAGGSVALARAYAAGQRDAHYAARAAALAALAKYGAAEAVPVLRTALADQDWAVRVRAVMLLKQLDPSTAADVEARSRPAPTTLGADAYAADRLVKPVVPPQVFIETDRGTIQIELGVPDAPLTVDSFLSLARNGFFNGLSVHRVVANFVVQSGDPRGDGEGGPGYTIRDELNQRPYLRGTVGMALDPWPDTGGSQFFITHSPQPHLDARYTVFGRVIDGMNVVDQIQQWDVIRRVRVVGGE